MQRKRLREYGMSVGELPTGEWNSITDVPSVAVGHVTLHPESGYAEGVCTGVTAILPHEGNWFRQKVAAASHVINGFGKTTGLVQLQELGVIESPILLTNTFGVPAATEGALQVMLERDDAIGDRTGSLNVVVGECNDSYLNDMRGLHVRPEHAREAIRQAKRGPVAEGCVGAGTGMVCFGWKGGIGTASRRIEVDGKAYHVGVLVLSNFGVKQDLTVLGHPVGKLLTDCSGKREQQTTPDGSIMIVIATDLPMCSRQLQRLAKRAAFGLARTGSIAHHGSGDIVIAFSNGNRIPHDPEQGLLTMRVLREDGPFMSQCFRAAVEATEEAILNSLFLAETTTGRLGRTVEALPVETVLEIIRTRR
ncbi:DmpA family aminopeptidase [Effusibacillus pohliae]|uniref:DmpA family aminopeptidase n=1 Tax=Effusibacillus pohliae TaxID=232270 RepID=UPI000369921E|nr:P1 family peptidase [Effusibacillus pohliae]